MRDGLVAAPAGRLATRSTSAPSSTRSAACPTSIVARPRSSSWARRRRSSARRDRPARGVGARRGAGAPPALVRQRRRGARRPARLGVRRRRPRADARRLPDRVEQDPPAHAAPPGWPPDDGASPRGVRGGARRRAPTTGRAWPTAGASSFEERLQAIARRGASRCACACSAAPQVGYQRMTRRWWAPVRARPQRARARRRAAVLRLLQHALALQPRHRAGARARGRARRPSSSAASHRGPPGGARALPRRAHRGLVGELPVLRGARLLRRRRPRAARASATRPRSRPASTHIRSQHRAARPRAGHPAGAARPRAAWTRGWARSTPSAWRRSEAVVVNIDYPLGLAAYNLLREVAVDSRRPARRLRARQGGDAQRRRRRRDDLVGHPRRALGHDVLARQRVHRRRHRARPACSARAWTTSAR